MKYVKRPKYFSYELVTMVKEKVDKFNSVDECAKHYKVDEKLLKVILKNPAILSYDMYKLISVMLDKTIKELTELEDMTINYQQVK